MARTVIGVRHTRSLACFVASEPRFGRALPLPWPARDHPFFEKRFVLWPLQQILDQSDRYAIVLTDKDDGRLFLFFQERIEEVRTLKDEILGRIRYPERSRELESMRKHIESYHEHFGGVGDAALRLFQRDPFGHLIIGGLWETLAQFEGRLHRYLRDRMMARWVIDVQHAPTPEVEEQARRQEQQLSGRRARDTWAAIQDRRPGRGALGPAEVFAAVCAAGPDAAGRPEAPRRPTVASTSGLRARSTRGGSGRSTPPALCDPGNLRQAKFERECPSSTPGTSRPAAAPSPFYQFPGADY